MGNQVVRCASNQARTDSPEIKGQTGTTSQVKTSSSSSSPDDRMKASQTSDASNVSDFAGSESSGNFSSGSGGDAETCPGSYDDLHKKCKDVLPINFEGAKFMIQKPLNQHFQVSHTISLSAMANSYRFGVTYAGTKQIGPQEVYPVILVDTDISGNQTATVIHQWRKFRCRVASQIHNNKFAGAQGGVEYRGRLSTLCVLMANPDLVNESGFLLGQYLRKVHPKVDMGLELGYQYGKQIPGGQASNLTYAARYNGQNCTVSGAVGKSGLHLCYYHKQQENLQFGVEWETNLRLGESVASIAYQVDLPKANVVFRASADTQWTVAAVMEKKMAPLPFTFALSGMINHARNQSKFGIGLIIG